MDTFEKLAEQWLRAEGLLKNSDWIDNVKPVNHLSLLLRRVAEQQMEKDAEFLDESAKHSRANAVRSSEEGNDIMARACAAEAEILIIKAAAIREEGKK